MRWIIPVALHTGMRLGEFLNLKHADIDFVTGVLTSPEPNNGESRHIPMDSAATSLFKQTPKLGSPPLIMKWLANVCLKSWK